MLVSVELPDPIAKQLHLDGEQGNRRALEIFALEGYRTGELSRGQISELLDLEFMSSVTKKCTTQTGVYGGAISFQHARY